ncbi:MAG: hypothetical protein LKG11_05170 [Bacilli bacterium]|jgi:hypothetical protein|nr:hypothetical protein [Bacilli bacterium]
METTPKAKKPPYLLMMIVTIAYLVVTAFFEEGVAFFDPVYTTLMSGTEFYLTFALCVVLALMVFYLARFRFHIKTNWVFLSLVSLLFVIDVVAVFCFPEFTVGGGVYHLTTDLRFRYVTFWAAACIAFYVMFAIMPKSVINVRQWNVYFFGGLVIGVSACIYSYIVETSTYAVILDPQNSSINANLLSFTNNRNTYGTVVFVAMVSSFFLAANTRRWWWSVVGVFLLANQFLIQSRTSLVISILFALFYFVWNLVKTFKSHLAISIVKISILALLVSFLFSIKPSGLADKVPFLSKVSQYFSFYYDLTNPSTTSSFYSRSNIWSLLLTLVFSDPVRILFGTGDWNFSWLLGSQIDGLAPSIGSAHSGFFDVLGRLGLLGVTLYIALLSYFVFCYVKCLKAKRYGTTLSLALFVCVLFHGLFEDTNFLNMQTKDMMLLFMTYMPLMTNLALLKKPGTKEKRTAKELKPVLIGPKRGSKALRGAQIFLVAATPAFAIAIGLSAFYGHYGAVAGFLSPFFPIQLGLMYIASPFVIHFLIGLKGKGRTRLFAILLSAFIALFVTDAALSFSGVSNLVSVIVLGVLWAAFLSVSVALDGKAGLKPLLVSCAIYFSIEAALVTVSLCVTDFLLIPSDDYQPYAAMVLILLDLAVPALFAICSPLSQTMLAPYENIEAYVENLYQRLTCLFDTKYEVRLAKATKRKVPLRYQ